MQVLQSLLLVHSIVALNILHLVTALTNLSNFTSLQFSAV